MSAREIKRAALRFWKVSHYSATIDIRTHINTFIRSYVRGKFESWAAGCYYTPEQGRKYVRRLVANMRDDGRITFGENYELIPSDRVVVEGEAMDVRRNRGLLERR